MNKLTLDLENCFGINKLNDCEFDFTQSNVVAIYSRNGTMKTSFAKTFSRLQENKQPEDELYGLPASCDIKLDSSDIDSQQIFVVKSFDKSIIGSEEGVTTLLVDEVNKERYEELNRVILKEKNSLIADLNRLSGLKKDSIENTIKSLFNYNDFFELLEGEDISEFLDEYSDIKYQTIFNDDVLKILKDPDVAPRIQDYDTKYREILSDNANLYKQGIFNPMRALASLNSLKRENFFTGGHKVHIDGDTDSITEAEFKEKLEETRRAIIEDQELKKIEELITKKTSVRDFQDLLETKPGLLSELTPQNLSIFRKKMWCSYLKKLEEKITALLVTYNASKAEIKAIEEVASQQENEWHELVKKYTDKFYPPYKLDIENKKSAILGLAKPNIVFKFKDTNGNEKTFDKKTLEGLDILSMGERRVFYLLHVMYELEAMKNNQEERVIIIDDIADSFDYKNKYAIVEYLKELSEENNFKLVILTHNFDFFRTIHSRLAIPHKNCFTSHKTETELTLIDIETQGIISPFENWKKNCKGNKKLAIALIPFLRNLIEYGVDNNLNSNDIEDDYLFLTNLLHLKQNTQSLTFADLEVLIQGYLDSDSFEFDKTEAIYDSILGFAAEETQQDTLESKIILSIAIRLQAERFMKTKIQSSTIQVAWDKNRQSGSTSDFLSFVETTHKPQTRLLFDGYVQITNDKKSLLESVNMMTPENIHLNSFMYEPILDMDIRELKELYSKIKDLN